GRVRQPDGAAPGGGGAGGGHVTARGLMDKAEVLHVVVSALDNGRPPACPGPPDRLDPPSPRWDHRHLRGTPGVGGCRSSHKSSFPSGTMPGGDSGRRATARSTRE